MTDSIIQFKYSDDVHMIAIYIKSDSHQEEFIPFLLDVVNSCEVTSNRRGWDYVVTEIISKITQRYESLVKIIPESQLESTVIYKYSISIQEEYYKSNGNKLRDFLTIKYLDSKEPFDGLLKDFNAGIIQDNNEYRIKELTKQIKEKQEELKNLKK